MKIRSVSASSTIRPKYMTATRVARCSTTQVMADEKIGEPQIPAQGNQEVQDLGLDRYVEEEVGSSQITTSGCMINARATATRWRCSHPESWPG